MKRHLQKAGLAMLTATALFSASCKKDAKINTLNTGNFTDTSGTLKSLTASSYPNVGMALTYSYAQDAKTMAILKREVNNITFGNELKEGSVVKNDGTYDYTTADAFYSLAAANGLAVFGHNLVWYSQQNATYLNGLLSKLSTPSVPAPNLLAGLNGDFEQGSGNTFTNWSNLAGNGSSATFTAVAGNNSTRAMQANVQTAGANAYDVQSIGPGYTVTAGHTINFSVDIKSSSTTGKVRVVIQNAGYQQYDITTTGGNTWTTYNFSLTSNEANPIFRFNFPTAGVYTIDNIVIQDPSQAVAGVGATAAQKATVIDGEMKRYITTTIQHYSGKIKAWDVVNEPLTDAGALRDATNYTIPTANASNQFLYAQYVGASDLTSTNTYIYKAFSYAKAADPTITTFVNDYNLEYATAKTDAMVKLVKGANANGQIIDGIGTQLHINLGTNLGNIDYMFKNLAATGLKIRISELDVALNPGKAGTFTPDALQLGYQAAMYKYVIQAYLKYVPAAQRYGVTVWGVTDNDSWLNTTAAPDAPLLFDKNYIKKPAYAGYKQGLTQPL